MSAAVSRRVALISGLFAWLVGLPLAFGVVPWALSLLAARHGWSDGRPGPWNLLGLMPVDWTPKVLLRSGPYARSRNPMYLGERIVWLGWAILYGSVILAVGLVFIAAGQSLVVRREERDLEARFGEAYLEYARAVPRWLGRRGGRQR